MAPFAYRVTRVTLIGTSFNGAEEWSTGFYMGAENQDADLPTQELADGIREAWRAFFTSQGSYFSEPWTTDMVKVSSIGTDGKSDAMDTVYSSYSPIIKGTKVLVMPPQVSLAATLTGNNARGLASKGRMFLPLTGAPVTNEGKIDGNLVNTIAANFKTFINEVNMLPSNNVVILASHGSLNPDGSPKIGGRAALNAAVQGIRIGNVYDTQRRRRNGLNETYTALPLL